MLVHTIRYVSFPSFLKIFISGGSIAESQSRYTYSPLSIVKTIVFCALHEFADHDLVDDFQDMLRRFFVHPSPPQDVYLPRDLEIQQLDYGTSIPNCLLIHFRDTEVGFSVWNGKRWNENWPLVVTIAK